MAVPFHQVPRSPLSTQLTGARRFVAQSWPFERVRAVGKAYDATLNDTVLAMCAGALRKQLPQGLQKLVAGELAKDLTGVPATAIAETLKDENIL